MNEHAAQLAALLLAYPGILGNCAHLLVKDAFFLFVETPDRSFKASGLNDPHG
jgi:hypothetical protein